MATHFSWEKLKDKDLLELTFADLNLSLTESHLFSKIRQLYRELESKGLHFRPHVWIADEWFSQDGIPGIAIPFYLLSPRLEKLHKRFSLPTEGLLENECMKLLRHEAGHAVDNAFRLRKSKARQRLFGLSCTDYPETYEPKVYSKKYVTHLRSNYAQAHPDEDWAETFAVWLTPDSLWKKRYAKWPTALKKLEFVDQTMTRLRGKDPMVTKASRPGELASSPMRLKDFYQNRASRCSQAQHTDFEPLLKKLFSSQPSCKDKIPASRFLRKERPLLRGKVAQRTGHYQYTIDQLLEEVIQNCQRQKLRLKNSEERTRRDLLQALTANAPKYLKSGFHRISM